MARRIARRATPGAVLAAAVLVLASPAAAGWKELSPGLDLGSFRLKGPAGEAELKALRVDPVRWDLELHCISEHQLESGLTAKAWAARQGLVAAINAGMYATDYRTHVGHLRNGKHVNNSHRNAYRSVAAFRPRREGLPPFRIEDLDAPGASLDSVIARYDCVAQNLRLIKRPRENRWTPKERRWSEAALGEDSRGRALFLFCRTPFSMHELVEALLALDELDLVAAQHLEGGAQAQLYVNAGGRESEWVGGTESGGVAWPVPNVIGVRRKR